MGRPRPWPEGRVTVQGGDRPADKQQLHSQPEVRKPAHPGAGGRAGAREGRHRLWWEGSEAVHQVRERKGHHKGPETPWHLEDCRVTHFIGIKMP